MEKYSDVIRAHRGKVSDKWSSYLDIYDRLFAPLRNAPLSILEIGVQNGGSLEIYDRFFQKAIRIVGVDANPRCADLRYDSDKVELVIGDVGGQSTKEKITQISKQFDVIVDDGSHISRDIIEAFLLYFPLLVPGGIYVVEDVSCSYWRNWEGALFYERSSITFFKTLLDVVNAEHWGIKEGPRDLLQLRFPNLRTPIPDDVCNEIFSITVFNSVVVITKNDEQKKGRLGTRVTVGSEATVVPLPPELHGSSITPDESGNPWSKFPVVPKEK